MKSLDAIRESVIKEDMGITAQDLLRLQRFDIINQHEAASLKRILVKIGGTATPNKLVGLTRQEQSLLLDVFMRLLTATVSSSRLAGMVGDAQAVAESQTLDELNLPSDPPWMLMFKRSGVRIFPNGKRVAMYNNAKLDITVAIPYQSGGTPQDEDDLVVPVSEGAEMLKEDVLSEGKVVESLRNIIDKHQASKVTFKNGTTSMVDAATAKALVTVFDNLSPENQKKFESFANKDKASFMKLVDFSWKNVKLSYSQR